MKKKKHEKGRKAKAMRAAAPDAGARTAMELYVKVLRQLNETVLRMTSADFDALLQGGAVEDRQRAARALLDVQHARLALGNAVLSDIAEKLKANEQAFIDGENELDTQLKNLAKIDAVLDTIGKFVKLVGSVVTLV